MSIPNKKEGLLYFHQGFTDIWNQLSLIDYYMSMYEKLTVIIREEAKPYVEFYLRNKTNVLAIYTPLHTIHSQSILGTLDLGKYDLLFHGYYDSMRNDEYRNRFVPVHCTTPHFVEAFFTAYDISYNVLIDCFNVERDLTLEENFYNKFIQQHGENYVLKHDTSERPIEITSEYPIVNLNGVIENMFEAIKVIQQAKEIHVIDSVWARFCYMMDAKYKTFADKTVNIYKFLTEGRLGGSMNQKDDVLHPVSLSNWIIK